MLVIAPATGNTSGKLANGIAEQAVTMAAKSHLRNGRPVVLHFLPKTALQAVQGTSEECWRTGKIIICTVRQDDPEKKPTSLVADFGLVNETVRAALEGKQLQPMVMIGEKLRGREGVFCPHRSLPGFDETLTEHGKMTKRKRKINKHS